MSDQPAPDDVPVIAHGVDVYPLVLPTELFGPMPGLEFHLTIGAGDDEQTAVVRLVLDPASLRGFRTLVGVAVDQAILRARRSRTPRTG